MTSRSPPITIIITMLILIGVVLSIGILSVFTYTEARSVLLTHDLETRDYAESNLIGSYTLMDRDLTLFDDFFSTRLENSFPPFLDAYNCSGGDPQRIDLNVLKGELGGDIDLYVIDDHDRVIATTYTHDLGMDLSQFNGFSKTLAKMRNGSGYYADRVTREQDTGIFRKYAYYPTPDHRYLLELGLEDSGFMARKNVSFVKTAQQIQVDNPSLVSVRTFNIYGDQIGEREFQVDPELRRQIDLVIANRSTFEVRDAANATLTRFRFVDLKNSIYASDPSLVIEFVYTTRPLDEALFRLSLEHLLIGLLVLTLGAIVASGISVLVVRPIRQIIEDVEAIANGNLNHPIGKVWMVEFDALSQSIHLMVDRLKQQMDQITHQNEVLEARVGMRTRQLVQSNDEIHLYLDIMTHDINNALTIALGSAEMLDEMLPLDHPNEHKIKVDRIRNGIQKSIGIIARVSMISRVHDTDIPLSEISLDREVMDAIGHYPDASIEYTRTSLQVCADQFLSEVFVNLFGNSLKFGGPDARVWVLVEAGEEEVTISVEDNGPGISDWAKSEIFGRYARGEGHGSGSGLGLFIAASLVARYGGRIWVDDRVASSPELGTALRFTLHRHCFEE
ncbi:ATP-binding protein [Methanosphaerula subterraneus]|uniref:sensor histidine kinase n=1 Tax=Methanosphaerula subterraneus TaxID=3350244 RepID=UPI003F84FA7A